MKRIHVLLVILMVGSTAGCTGASSPTPTTDAPEPAPTVTVTANAAPVERVADSPLTALDVYASCQGQTSSFLYLDGSAPSDLVYSAFSDCRIEQIDTTWFALIGVSGTSADPVNLFCGVSGSIGNPVWERFGAGAGARDGAAWDGLVAEAGWSRVPAGGRSAARGVALALAAAVVVATVPLLVLWARAVARRRALRAGWPDVVDLLLSGVRAGLSLPQAIAGLADNAPNPVRAPFRAFHRDYLRTAQFTECLDTLEVTLADPVADRIVETVRMAREVGGTELPTVLRSLSHYLRADAAMPPRVTSSGSPDVKEV